MNVPFDLEPLPLFPDPYLQARSRRNHAYGKTIRHRCDRITRSARRAWARFGIWLLLRHVMRELHTLDDRTLADIGIPRGEIATLARHAARRCARTTLRTS